MLTGKISFRGEMALGIKLGYWIRKAAKQEEAAEGGEESVPLEIAETDKWERDEDTHVCGVCEQDFKVSELLRLTQLWHTDLSVFFRGVRGSK